MADFAEEIERFLASFPSEQLAVMRHAFRSILEGRPTKVGELPVALDLPSAVVEEAVGHLTERGILVVEPETVEITGARGISLAETSHRLVLNGRQRYAFCAVDAVGIPVALEWAQQPGGCPQEDRRYEWRGGCRGEHGANEAVVELDPAKVDLGQLAARVERFCQVKMTPLLAR